MFMRNPGQGILVSYEARLRETLLKGEEGASSALKMKRRRKTELLRRLLKT